MNKPTAKLCYIDASGAYFTTQDLATQWGDDWDDYPYQHNAGTPYSAGRYYFSDGRVEPRSEDWNPDGTPKWYIIRVEFAPPATTEYASERGEFCVADINRKRATPWITFKLFPRSVEGNCTLWAGTPIDQFINWIVMNGGYIFNVEVMQ